MQLLEHFSTKDSYTKTSHWNLFSRQKVGQMWWLLCCYVTLGCGPLLTAKQEFYSYEPIRPGRRLWRCEFWRSLLIDSFLHQLCFKHYFCLTSGHWMELTKTLCSKFGGAGGGHRFQEELEFNFNTTENKHRISKFIIENLLNIMTHGVVGCWEFQICKKPFWRITCSGICPPGFLSEFPQQIPPCVSLRSLHRECLNSVGPYGHWRRCTG